MKTMFVAAALCVPVAAMAVPMSTSHQGRLLDSDGSPVNGTHSVVVTLFGDAGGTQTLFSQSFTSVSFEQGYYSVVLDTDDDSDEPLDTGVFAGDVYMSVTAAGTQMMSSTPMASVPRAGFASHVDGAVRAASPVDACVPTDAATHGLLRFDAGLRVCTANGWQTTALLRTLAVIDGAIQYSDGGTAPSCEDYRRPKDGVSRYEGVTGSGQYRIDAGRGDGPVVVQCDMETQGGGWTVLVDHDYTGGDACPGAFVGVSASNDVNASLCWRNIGGAGFRSASFPSPVPYTEVAARPIGHQYYSMDAFNNKAGVTIDGSYVDGISLTVGSPRQHIYTWGVGLHSGSASDNCPAIGGTAAPAWLGSDWTCETGNPATTYTNLFYSTQMFDDITVHPLPSTTTDALELRLMSDQASSNEDIALRSLLLMVR